MRPPAAGLLRLALLAYPPSFRKGYGEEMARCVRDLRDHGGMSRGRLGLHVAADVLLTAPLGAELRHRPVAAGLGLVVLVSQRGGRRVA